MVKIRLQRKGKKKEPAYRLVIMESSRPRDGKTLEIIGFYKPCKKPIIFEYKKERMQYWLNVGAQPTNCVRRLVNKEKLK